MTLSIDPDSGREFTHDDLGWLTSLLASMDEEADRQHEWANRVPFQWTAWAERLAALMRELPAPPTLRTFLCETGESEEVPTTLDSAGRRQLIWEHLEQALESADAVAADARRRASQVQQRQAQARTLVAGWRELAIVDDLQRKREAANAAATIAAAAFDSTLSAGEVR